MMDHTGASVMSNDPSHDNLIGAKSLQNDPVPGSSSPVPPHWSPITPTAEPAEFCMIPDDFQLFSNPDRGQTRQDSRTILTNQSYIKRTFRGPTDALLKPPASLSVAEDENPDAIALRAALDILQLQRRKAMSDIRRLRDRKDEALADPEAFVHALSCDSVESEPDRASRKARTFELCDSQSTVTQASDETNISSKYQRFVDGIPGAQNIVRCPPINWAKYSVNGELLDGIHSEVRRAPHQHVQENAIRQAHTDQTGYTFAGPYRPYID